MTRHAALAALVLASCARSRPAPPRPAATSVMQFTVPSVAASERDAGDASPTQADAKPKGPWNVILISVDCLRADMPWAGYERAIAPRLTELHRRAVDYSSGYSISSFTSKSVGGLLAGKYPSELLRTGQFFTRYLPQNKMFCESLGEQGVPCVAGHAHGYFIKGVGGFEQGFQEWRLVPAIAFDAQTDPNVTSQKLTPLAIEMLSDQKLTSRPFFAWFHYMDPHDRYIPHPESPKFGTKNRDIYDEEVFFADLWIGKLLDFIAAQPWAERTVLIVTADHGEAFGEHGLVRHASELYEVLVHVPLFFVVPGQPARRIEAPRSHVDLAPTIMDLLGATPYAELDGKTFKEELFGGPAEPRDVICDLPRDDFNARHRSLLHDGLKIIAFGEDSRFELYDLKHDPDEKNDLFKKDPEKARAMVLLYKEASKRIIDAPARY